VNAVDSNAGLVTDARYPSGDFDNVVRCPAGDTMAVTAPEVSRSMVVTRPSTFVTPASSPPLYANE